MSLLCGKNPALDAVNAIRDQIKAQLSSKKGALGGLASQVSAITSKISELKAKVTNLDSFQAELAALVGADPVKIAAFKEKWKGKVAELDALVAKTTSGLVDALDFCKDVPNVKMDPATGSTVQEAKEAPTPNTPPVKVEPVTPTVIDNSKKTSTGNSGVVSGDIKAQFEELVQAPYQKDIREILWKDFHEKQAAETALKKSFPLYRFVSDKNGTPEQIELANSIKTATLKRWAADVVKTAVDNYFKFNVEMVDTSDWKKVSEIQYWKTVKEIGNRALQLADDPVLENMQDIRPWLVKTDSILKSNAQVVIDYAKYKDNTS